MVSASREAFAATSTSSTRISAFSQSCLQHAISRSVVSPTSPGLQRNGSTPDNYESVSAQQLDISMRWESLVEHFICKFEPARRRCVYLTIFEWCRRFLIVLPEATATILKPRERRKDRRKKWQQGYYRTNREKIGAYAVGSISSRLPKDAGGNIMPTGPPFLGRRSPIMTRRRSTFLAGQPADPDELQVEFERRNVPLPDRHLLVDSMWKSVSFLRVVL